jgi:hypothetical protein
MSSYLRIISAQTGRMQWASVYTEWAAIEREYGLGGETSRSTCAPCTRIAMRERE